MAKTFLVVAISSSVRRGIRCVGAFYTGSNPERSFLNERYQPPRVRVMGNHDLPIRRLSMSAAADVKITKRVKTADAVPSDDEVIVKGWVRTVRKQKTLAFVEVNDGSNLSGLQCVLPFDQIDDDSKNSEFHENSFPS